MMPTEGIIFDMDGVLLHSSPLHEKAYREALSHLPIRNFDYRAIAGMRTRDAVALVLANNNISYNEEEAASIAHSKTAIALELIRRANPIADDCIEVLRQLS